MTAHNQEASDVVGTAFLMLGVVFLAIVFVMSTFLFFMMIHGDYHIEVNTGEQVYIETSSALAFAEDHVQAMRQQHPTWKISCLDCTPLTSVFNIGEIMAFKQRAGQ